MNGTYEKNKNHHRMSQTLKMQNGYRYPVNLPPQQSVKYPDILSEYNYIDPEYTYPVLRRPKVVRVEPQYVIYEKLVLTYFATCIETVAFYPEDMNRRRNVKVLYFLEDDTMAVIEGNEKVVRRKRHLKSSTDVFYYWKDLNIGQEIRLNGIRFQIFDCDRFTKDFMTSKGIEFEVDDLTVHLQTAELAVPAKTTVPGIGHAKDDPFKVVLSFDCQMETKDSLQKDNLTFKLFYNTENSAITIKELKENQEGRHKFSFYLRRAKVPKDESSSSSSFLTATDLRVGEIVSVFGTRFLITDCDQFTRDHFSRVLRFPQPPKTHPFAVTVEKSSRQPTVPKYLGLGTPEDSLSSTFSLRPRTPKMATNSDEILRYNCRLEDDSQDPLHRQFILQFNVKYGTMTIVELPIDNSGIMQGRFVTSQRVRKPNTHPDLPEFYSPSDLLVGQVILVNCHRFRITAADKGVYQFMEKYPEKFPQQKVGATTIDGNGDLSLKIVDQ